MPLIDFTEIPEAHKGGGKQDTFEQFARDFFANLGYTILRDPSRGADGGCDLILEENRQGISGVTKVKWLVSCKHKAHSGASVLKGDEPEVKDSVEKQECQGFIGFYSTLPSSGLLEKVQSIKNLDSQFFDSEKIEQILLSTQNGRAIAERYFPTSYQAWTTQNPGKAQIFSDANGLKCKNCGADVTEGRTGIVVLWERFIDADGEGRKRHVVEVYWCCRGECDRELRHPSRHPGYGDKWEDIFDLRIPTIYIKWTMSLLNQIQGNYEYTAEAFEAHKELLLQLFPYVSRNLCMNELQRVNDLGALPSWMGGLGNCA